MMMLLRMCVVAAFALPIFVQQSFAQDDEAPTLADIILDEYPEMATFLENADDETLDLLNDPSAELTLFIPDEDAFERWRERIGEEAYETLLNEQAGIILQQHLFEGEIVAEELIAYEDGSLVETLAGGVVAITFEGASVLIDNAQVLIVDIPAANGVIHVVDAVFTPSPDETVTIADIFRERTVDPDNPDFTVFLAAVEAVDPTILELLDDPEAQLTVFAPLDDAFDLLEDEERSALFEDEDALRDLVLNHIVEGQLFAANVIAASNADPLESLLGQPLVVTITEGGSLYVNNAQVIIIDIETANGVIHVIRRLLEP